MTNKKYYDLSKECQTIIKNNTPIRSMEIISNIRIPQNNKKLNKSDALKIYILYADLSVKYDREKYGNNINLYKKKVENNIRIASQF